MTEVKVNDHITIKTKSILYLVGKIQVCFGTGRLLLYSAFGTRVAAEQYIEKYINKYYKQKPYLCLLVIKRVER